MKQRFIYWPELKRARRPSLIQNKISYMTPFFLTKQFLATKSRPSHWTSSNYLIAVLTVPNLTPIHSQCKIPFDPQVLQVGYLKRLITIPVTCESCQDWLKIFKTSTITFSTYEIHIPFLLAMGLISCMSSLL